MKKLVLILVLGTMVSFQANSQCTFETLFPLKWGAAKYAINEHFQNNTMYKTGHDTITASAFKHGLNYFFTMRDKQLYFFSYVNVVPIPCFKTGNVIMNAVATDSGLVAYNYQVDFPADQRAAYQQVIDSLKKMMDKKFVYRSAVENKTFATDAGGSTLSGEGVCIYYNDEPIISSNLTYAQFVVRAGYLARTPAAASDTSAVIRNQAENIKYYRIEILYKEEKVHH